VGRLEGRPPKYRPARRLHRHDLAAFQRGLHTGGGTADAGDGTCTPTHRCAYTGTVQRPLGDDGTLHPGNSSRES